MITSSGLIRGVIAKHLYAILTYIECQWIFNFPISELALHTDARGDVLVNNFSV